jgi:hypothetical protein
MRGVIDADEKNIFNLFPYLIDIYIYIPFASGWKEGIHDHDDDGDDICRIIPIRRCVYSSSWLGVENTSSCGPWCV